MSDYLEEYEIAGRHYGIKDREADHMPFQRYQCWAAGCSFCEGHKSLRQARLHIIEHATNQLHGETAQQDARQREICAALVQLVQKPGRGSGPRENNLIPFYTGTKRVRPKLEVLVRHHFSIVGEAPVYEVTTGPDDEDHAYMDGIPLSAFHVPTETGRRYRLTIEELPDSNPQPEENPWRKGHFA